MRALITGGTGYVAAHLGRRLLADGHAVRLTSRSAAPPAGATENLAGAEWIQVPDIGPETDWSAALDGIDVVFHLAGIAHRLSASQTAMTDEYERVNALATGHLARSFVRRGGRGRIVLLSSIGAVCTTSNVLVTAATEPRPDSAYGRSKLHAECLLAQACEGSRIEWCALRAPLVYGPRAPGNMQRLLRLALRGVPLPLGRARARRTFIFVGNLADALAICAHAEVAGRVLPVADGESTCVADLLRLAAQITGRPVRLIPLPLKLLRAAASVVDTLRPGARDRNDRLVKSVELLFGALELDAAEFRSAAHWCAPYSLREGLAATLAVDARRP